MGGEVSLVVLAETPSGGREGLAGRGSGPNRSIIGPPSKSKSVTPPSDPRKEMALGEPAQVVGLDIKDGSFINFPRRNKVEHDQTPQPFRRERFIFVVVGSHFRPPFRR